MINSVDFDFKGNKYGIKGPFLMTNTNLKVELLDDKNQKKKKFLSFLTNWFIKNNTGNTPKQIDVDYTRKKISFQFIMARYRNRIKRFFDW